jgi:biotin operon repressor
MLQTSARLLRILSLLQIHRDWTCAQLAERLGVSSRTVRSDIDKLRSLGYPVHASPGVSGGYRLGSGAALPPLLLDDDEAVAVAIGLRTAAGGTVSGIEETSVQALAKLEQILPSRLRHRISAMTSATVTVPGGGPTVDADVLTAIAGADPRERAAALRLRHPRRRGRCPRHGAAPAGELGTPLVPRRVGRRPGRLAHVPRRPDVPTVADRSAFHAAGAAGGRRLAARPTRRRGSHMALPGEGAAARPRRVRQRAATGRHVRRTGR